MGDVLSGEFKIPTSAIIAFDWSNANWAKPKPILQAERARVKGENPSIPALFVL